MFLALWEFEVKPGREQSFEEVYGPAATGIPFSAPTRIMREPDCSVTQIEAVSISLPTTGSPANPTRNSLLFGRANTIC
jgi:hypothetical protein